jgi:molybdopterin-guanine dinucleotide biosynthesis protein A
MSDFDAVVLAGGRGSRLGGVSKADLVVGGVRLLDRVLGAVADAATTVVVGRVAVPQGVLVTLEDPPGTGPAAGIVAGLDAVERPAEWTAVLACDLPDAAGAVAALRAAASGGEGDAFAIRNREGGPEWLLGLYKTASLRAAAEAYGDPSNRSVGGLLGPLEPRLVDPGDALPGDLDTWADHARWNAHYRRRRKPMTEDSTAWGPFVERACRAVGVDPGTVDTRSILDMTREVAHAGARPMAPVSSFILGVAVGRGGDPEYLRRVLEDAAHSAPIPVEEG